MNVNSTGLCNAGMARLCVVMACQQVLVSLLERLCLLSSLLGQGGSFRRQMETPLLRTLMGAVEDKSRCQRQRYQFHSSLSSQDRLVPPSLCQVLSPQRCSGNTLTFQKGISSAE